MPYGPIYDESPEDGDPVALNTGTVPSVGTTQKKPTGIIGDPKDVPEHKDITFGTKDLAWIIPAVIAALSGRNGQQLAGSLAAGALQGKLNRNAADNKTAVDVWKAKHPGKDKQGSGDDAQASDQFDPIHHGLQAIAMIKSDPFHAQFYKSLFAMQMKKAAATSQNPEPTPQEPTWA